MKRGGTGETRGQVVRRRLRTIPPLPLGLIVVTALLPALLAAALFTDLVRWALRRRPFMALRLTLFLWVYLAAEVAGLLALLAVWVASLFGLRRPALLAGTWSFQQRWTGALFGAARLIFGLRLEVDGDGVVEPGPMIVLVRHVSIVDNLLPSVLVAARHRIHLRYVLKRELLSDPCIDVAATRLPNLFVRRDSGDPLERAKVGELSRGLGRGDGVLLYPEGTRFTSERRERAIERIAQRDPQLARSAAQIEHLLPPRTGGVLAALDAAPQADVLILAHHGFDGLRLISDIWKGALVGRTIHVRLTRIPREQVPDGREEQIAWLYERWLEMDRWVAAEEAAAAA